MRADEAVFAATTPGLEEALLAEARLLGWQARAVAGGVELSGDAGLHQEANLHLRCASRVLLRVGRFEVRSPGELKERLRSLSLAPYWERRAPLALGVSASGAPGSWVEPAVREVYGPRQLQRFQEESAQEGLGLLIRLEPVAGRSGAGGRGGGPGSRQGGGGSGFTCTVSVDTSGELLYRRGYRQEVSRAPLRETLAAGMLRLAGYDGQRPLHDPMCGSGTLLIEAAWMALRRAPGLGRGFAFERWPSFQAADWEARRERARAQERAPADLPPIIGTDLNAGALGTARRNARRAGILERLRLERADVATLAVSSGPPGLLIANPPYGIRVGERGAVEPLYRALGATARRAFAGWRVAVLVPEPKLEKALGLEPRARHALSNGGIRCHLVVA